jgi:hypothetical protein
MAEISLFRACLWRQPLSYLAAVCAAGHVVLAALYQWVSTDPFQLQRWDACWGPPALAWRSPASLPGSQAILTAWGGIGWRTVERRLMGPPGVP